MDKSGLSFLSLPYRTGWYSLKINDPPALYRLRHRSSHSGERRHRCGALDIYRRLFWEQKMVLSGTPIRTFPDTLLPLIRTRLNNIKEGYC